MFQLARHLAEKGGANNLSLEARECRLQLQYHSSLFVPTRAHRTVRLRSGRQDWTHYGIIKSQDLSKLVRPREAILQCPGLPIMVLRLLSQQKLQSLKGSRRVNLRHYDNVFWWTDQDPNKTYSIQRQLSSHRGSDLSQALRAEWKQKTDLGELGGIADDLSGPKTLSKIVESVLAGYHPN